jgi:hypothetical protein
MTAPLIPKIRTLDKERIELTDTTMIARRFVATFPDEMSTTMEIEMVAGHPMVRRFQVSSAHEDLAERPLRPAINGKLLPAAVRAACYSRIDRLLTGRTGHPRQAPRTGVAVIGPIQLLGRVHSQADNYDQASKQSLPRRPGRPHLSPEQLDLEKVAETYKANNSLTKTANALFLTKSTAHRRVKAARLAGLLE